MTTMTVHATPAITIPTTAAARPRLLTRPLLLLALVDFGAMISLYLLLSVVPLYTTSVGAGGVGAGLTTGALMLSSIAAELVTPRLVARFGYRLVLAAGLLLLGAPALVLPGVSNMTAILAVCVVRGLGFAIIVVAAGALTAALVPAERRGEGLGLIGVVAGVPAVIALPLGVWLVGRFGYPVVFVIGAATALIGLAAVAGLPGRQPQAGEELGVLAGLRSPALVRPAVAFAATAMAGGVVVTFLPAAVGHAGSGIVAVALLVQAAAATLTRWLAGRYADRHGAAGLLVPGVLVAAAGILALVVTDSPAAVLAGMVLFGVGFGIAQSASLTMMFDRVPASGYGTASALWNLAYDGGYGAGAAGFGVLAVQTGYPVAFALTAALMFAVVLSARRR
jgi:MFS family permease